MPSQNETILLVEDSADDVFFMRHALKKSGLPHRLLVVMDGQQAVDYLSGTKPYDDRSRYPLPSVVFLDLKLPFLNGFEVLAWIRAQPGLKDLAVFILTGSSEVRDRQRAEALGTVGYLVKPPDETMLRQALASVDRSLGIPAPAEA
ncbi:MAG TPA: response regulator [Verrucomicrobiae bacterium]|nr:response regulator [Verrucomicrobiae bacterium]